MKNITNFSMTKLIQNFYILQSDFKEYYTDKFLISEETTGGGLYTMIFVKMFAPFLYYGLPYSIQHLYLVSS